MKPLDQCWLYTFVDTAYLAGRAPETVAQQLCDGGSDVIQLRAKGADPAQVQRLAERILPIVQAAGVILVINDYPATALAVRAPMCHLGQEDFAPYAHVGELAQRLGFRPEAGPLGIGLSTHDSNQAQRAVAAGASYIAVGPVFRTGTKPAATPVTLEYVRWAAAHMRIPWFAIGGITLGNLDSVLEAGARRVCVVSAILQAPKIAEACQQFRNRLLSAGIKN